VLRSAAAAAAIAVFKLSSVSRQALQMAVQRRDSSSRQSEQVTVREPRTVIGGICRARVRTIRVAILVFAVFSRKTRRPMRRERTAS